MALNFLLVAGLLLLLATVLVSHLRTARALARISSETGNLSDAARDLAASQARVADERQSALAGMLAELHNAIATAEARQQQRNLEQLSAALAGVIADFNQRIMVEFDAQLKTLSSMSRSSQELYRMLRNEQMEAMHHNRRIATQMDQSTEEFSKLLADAATLAALAVNVRESLSLLGPRQEAIDGGMQQQAHSVQAMADAISDLRAGFDEACEQLIAQSRRAFDAMGQRTAQSNTALNKELNEVLAKGLAGLSKQVSALPMTQQIRPPARMAR